MSTDRINVTRTWLPEMEQYTALLQEVWDSGQLTNNGPQCRALETELQAFLRLQHLLLVCNGTVALQLAFKALDLKGEVITTPFSYVATVSAAVWQGLTPVFVDVDPESFCLDPKRIEAAITDKTSAILATHVYGHPCDVDAIQRIADKHGLKVVYDAAHAFGVTVNGRSVLEYGDVSTLSFHATKVFHTVEGGAVVSPHADVDARLSYLRNFGHDGPEAFQGEGINGKMSELHAAMGRCVLPNMAGLIANRKRISALYDQLLKNQKEVKTHHVAHPEGYNYAYYPVLFKQEEHVLRVINACNAANIYPRRYFYPTLNTLPYLQANPAMPVAEDLSKRVLCLPLSAMQTDEETERTVQLISSTLN